VVLQSKLQNQSPNSKSLKKYYAHIASNISIAKMVIKQIAIYAYSENTGSIMISTTRNLKSSEKLE